MGWMKEYHNISDLLNDCGFALPEIPMFSISHGIASCIAEIPAFIADFYMIVLHSTHREVSSAGNGVTGNMVFFKPSDVVQPEDLRADEQGLLILFQHDFLAGTALEERLINRSCFEYHGREQLQLRDQENALIRNIMQYMEMEYLHNQDEFSTPLIIAGLTSIFDYAGRFYKRQRMTGPAPFIKF